MSYQIFLKYMNDFSLKKFQSILNNFFPNINVDSEKVSVHNIACCQCLRNGNQLSIKKNIWCSPHGSFQGIWLPVTNILLTLKKLIIKESSHPEVFLKKGVLKVCCKFTGEHPCQSVRVQGAGWFLINILVFTSSVF